MARLELWIDEERPSPLTGSPELVQRLNTTPLIALRAGTLPGISDAAAAEQLLDLVWQELEAYGTDGTNVCGDQEIAVAIRTIESVTRRLGIPLELPFQNFTMFRSYWVRHDGWGKWQARRDIIQSLLEPTRRQLETLDGLVADPMIKEDLISKLRDPAAIREHLARLARTAVADPPLAIGTAKELVESTAKTVLEERGMQVRERDDLPALVTRAQEALGLHPSATLPGPDGTDAVKRILGGLISVASGLGELRNRGYGTGHGPKGERVGLKPRHARLAVNAAMTWCSLMLDTLADAEAPWRTGHDL